RDAGASSPESGVDAGGDESLEKGVQGGSRDVEAAVRADVGQRRAGRYERGVRHVGHDLGQHGRGVARPPRRTSSPGSAKAIRLPAAVVLMHSGDEIRPRWSSTRQITPARTSVTTGAAPRGAV